MVNHVPRSHSYMVVLEYDGAEFSGWQIQPQLRTIQSELARALKILFKEPICPVAAGRTDAGTHALGQVVHFNSRTLLAADQVKNALNGILPRDIAAVDVSQVPSFFHARFSALSKCYRYRVLSGKAALHRHQVWCINGPLDIGVMGTAADLLVGIHDFSAFCKRDPPPDNFRCNISAASWRKDNVELVFEIEANRFLRHMVRILVGTMVEIGLHRRSLKNLDDRLRDGDRIQAGITAPAHGLCLICVSYPDPIGAKRQLS